MRLYEHLRRESRTGRHLVLIVIPSAMARATRRPAGRKYPTLDIHRGIKLAVRYEATVLVAAVNEWL